MIPKLNHIHQGDVLAVLKAWPAAIAQTVVTSPPYWGLRNYGVAGQLGVEVDVNDYVKRMVEIFREVRRVLYSDGTLWLNLGDCFNAYNGNRGTDSPFAGAHAEAERPRVPSGAGLSVPWLKPKDMVGIPWRVAFALQADGWYLRSDIIWAKPNPMPESVTDRPTKSHEYLFLLTKEDRYFYDAEAIKERCSDSFLNDSRHERGARENKNRADYERAGAQDPKGPHRLFGKVKTPSGWNTGSGAHSGKDGRYATKKRTVRPGIDTKAGGQGSGQMSYPTDVRNKRSVWTVPTQPFADAHFATFPEKLIEPCILAGSQVGGVVLDPFMGAGTTALVAARLNRRFLGVELNPEYVRIAERRIAPELAQKKLAL